MNHHKNNKLDVHEEFDCSYLIMQIMNYKKWILISTVLFFSAGLFYCTTTPKMWSTQVQIQESSQDDQHELYALNREMMKLVYGFDLFNGNNILNEFIKFMENNSSDLKIRKDLDKSYLVELNSDSSQITGQDIVRILNTYNDQFFKEFLDTNFRHIRLLIQDENMLFESQNQIQLKLNTFLLENYIFRLNYFKTFSGQLFNPDITQEYINDSIDMLLVYGDRYLNNKYAILYSSDYQKQEADALKVSLAKVKAMLDQPMHPKAFHISQNVLSTSKSKSPNVPVILILSAVLGFTIGLFGILLYLSSSPVIRQK